MASFNFGGMMQGLGEGLQTVGKQKLDLLAVKEQRDWQERQATLADRRARNLEDIRNRRLIEAEGRAEERAIAAEGREEQRLLAAETRAQGYEIEKEGRKAAAESAKVDETLAKSKKLLQDKWTDVFESNEYKGLKDGQKSFLNIYHSAGVDPADALKLMSQVDAAAAKAGTDMKSATEAHLTQGENYVADLEEKMGYRFEPTVRAEMVSRWGTKLANPGLDLWDMTKKLTPAQVKEFASLVLKGEEGGDMMLLTPESRNAVMQEVRDQTAQKAKDARRAGYTAGARTTVEDAGTQAAERTRGFLRGKEFGDIY